MYTFTLCCFGEKMKILSIHHNWIEQQQQQKKESTKQLVSLSTQNPIKKFSWNAEKQKRNKVIKLIQFIVYFDKQWVCDMLRKVSQIVIQFSRHETLSRWIVPHKIRGIKKTISWYKIRLLIWHEKYINFKYFLSYSKTKFNIRGKKF